MEHGIAMEQMRGKWASSFVNFGYTEIFCIPELTSEFISSLDSVLGNSLVFYQENRGSLCVELGIGYCSARNAGKSTSSPSEGYVSWDFANCGRNVGYILEIHQG